MLQTKLFVLEKDSNLIVHKKILRDPRKAYFLSSNVEDVHAHANEDDDADNGDDKDHADATVTPTKMTTPKEMTRSVKILFDIWDFWMNPVDPSSL